VPNKYYQVCLRRSNAEKYLMVPTLVRTRGAFHPLRALALLTRSQGVDQQLHFRGSYNSLLPLVALPFRIFIASSTNLNKSVMSNDANLHKFLLVSGKRPKEGMAGPQNVGNHKNHECNF
jgi:hypothetical protein